MNALIFPRTNHIQNRKPITNLTSWMRNQVANLYNAVLATRDALAERLKSLRETASSLYNRGMGNVEYGRED